jgi:hypothetical protein
MPRNPASRQLVGIVVGVVEHASGERTARVAIYADRFGDHPLAELPLTWAADTFRPSLGARLAVTITPVD